MTIKKNNLYIIYICYQNGGKIYKNLEAKYMRKCVSIEDY